MKESKQQKKKYSAPRLWPLSLPTKAFGEDNCTDGSSAIYGCGTGTADESDRSNGSAALATCISNGISPVGYCGGSKGISGSVLGYKDGHMVVKTADDCLILTEVEQYG